VSYLQAELLADHHPLDLVGAFVDLGGLDRSSSEYQRVSPRAIELGRESSQCHLVPKSASEF
jgi:hypothetical protein